MLPCHGCGYSRAIPGDAHTQCAFAWTSSLQTVGQFADLIRASSITPVTRQWFVFPVNFDPTWGPDECPARADEADPAKLADGHQNAAAMWITWVLAREKP